MKKFTHKVLSAKMALAMGVAIACGPGFVGPAYAQLAVIDPANLGQSIATVIELVEAQILRSAGHDISLQNIAKPSVETWDDPQAIVNALLESIDPMSALQNSFGGTDAYLDKFQDTAYYRNSPCYSPAGCSAQQWAALNESRTLGSTAKKGVTDGLFKSVVQQESAMQTDAQQLQRLQSSARNADGQLAAQGYTNQLLSQIATQALQTRGLLAAGFKSTATGDRVKADQEAFQQAKTERAYRVPGKLPLNRILGISLP